MTAELRLLDEVSWRSEPLPGGRTHALLAALVAGERSGVSEEALVAAVWEDDVPANPAKALQVVVSRARSQTGPEVVVRTDRGYRIGLAARAVDALALADLVDAARRAEGRGDHVEARDRARAALELGPAADEGPAPSPTSARVPSATARSRGPSSVAPCRCSATTTRPCPCSRARPRTTPRWPPCCAARPWCAVRRRPWSATNGCGSTWPSGSVSTRPRACGPCTPSCWPPTIPCATASASTSRHWSGRDEDVRALRALVREARVVSILGPGGLGKTRLAHVLARGAEQQVVHFVELVSVVDPDDVVGEVGSALGVRDSVSSRRVLAPDQLRDVRARIAQALEQSPTLLVLDNCEQVVAAVADLVAFLVATVPTLRVVTTTRAPLGISAERVFPLAQLDEAAGTALFRQRALAARPDVSLPDDDVRRVVARLDGLPLAIELAAAKVRVMSVADVDRRLDDRFALLRGADRSKADRHQTLLAVIDWSWNLLTGSEQAALQRLSVFADGFTMQAADAVLGHDALDEVSSLVDQSLLTVVDDPVSVRYRMLETVREFGRLRLVEDGVLEESESAQMGWAVRLASARAVDLWSRDQVEAVAALQREENNLADCLRRALRAPDPVAVCRLLEALGAYWTITGENPRVLAVCVAVEDALRGWRPAADERPTAVAAATVVLLNMVTGDYGDTTVTRGIVEEHGGQVDDPRVAGTLKVIAAQDHTDLPGTLERLAALGESDDRHAAAQAWMWTAHYLENAADPEGALDAARRGLEQWRPEDGPWLAAMTRVMLGTMNAALGRHAEAATYLNDAIPDLDLLGDVDDAMTGPGDALDGRAGRRPGRGGEGHPRTSRARRSCARDWPGRS